MMKFLTGKIHKLLLWFWLADIVLVIILSLLPASVLPSTSVNDKLLHFSGYTVLAALAIVAIERRSRAVLAALSLCVLGGALEIGQMFVPGRSAEFGDFIANALGVVCGMCVAFFLKRFLV